MRKIFFSVACSFMFFISSSQELKQLAFDPKQRFTILDIKLSDRSFPVSFPAFSIELDRTYFTAFDKTFSQALAQKHIKLQLFHDNSFKNGYKASLVITNEGTKTVSISNIVPFGTITTPFFISGKRLSDTSRSYLFTGGRSPVGVVVPHNMNDLNFSAFELTAGYTVYGLIKRSPAKQISP